MTCIATFKTKKALREAVAAGQRVILNDPSVLKSRFIYTNCGEDTLNPGEDCFCTNHPKRSWFAQVIRKADGTYQVK